MISINTKKIEQEFSATELLEWCRGFGKHHSGSNEYNDLTLHVQDIATGLDYFCKAFYDEVAGLTFSIGRGVDGYHAFNELFGLLTVDNIGMSFMDKLKLFASLDGFAIHFSNRNELESMDYDFIKAAGVSFRGKKRWPMFKSYVNGMYDDRVNQTSDFAVIMGCLVAFSELTAKRGVVDSIFELASRMYPEEDDVIVLRSSMGSAIPYSVEAVPTAEKEPLMVDEFRLEKIKRLPQLPLTLEIIGLYAPTPFLNDVEGRLGYPHITLFEFDYEGDQMAPLILTNVSEMKKNIQSHLASQLIELGHRPTHIAVENEKYLGAVSALAKEIGINCRLFEGFEFVTATAQQYFDTILDEAMELDGELPSDDIIDDVLEDLKMNAMLEVMAYADGLFSEYKAFMNPKFRNYFVPHVTIFTQVMEEIYHLSEKEWESNATLSVCSESLKELMTPQEYKGLPTNLYNYLSLAKEERHIEQAGQIMNALNQNFKINRNDLVLKRIKR
ncbi:MAG TPA: hypothetical protein DCY20_03795 [Firmicutes bacterium]|nr:hypothetical protein [Bacillota bacterium]